MSSGNRIRILSVDDHPMLREGIAAVLGTEPDMVLVAEASNGREAIELYRVHHPDVTLMDLQRPVMNGTEAILAIRKEFPDARIIVLTTYAGDVQAVRADCAATGLEYRFLAVLETHQFELLAAAVHRRANPLTVLPRTFEVGQSGLHDSAV